jgi:hypothetical protein
MILIFVIYFMQGAFNMTKRVSLSEIRGIGDFATSYQWYVTVQRAAGANFPTAPEINLRCVSSEVPLLKDAPIETSIRGHKVWQPGIHNYTQSITLTMAEAIDMKINQWIKDWREACWQSFTGIHKLKSEVEAAITLVRLNRQDQPIWKYHLVGCFLSDYTQDTLGTENSTLKPTMVINYDGFTDERL